MRLAYPGGANVRVLRRLGQVQMRSAARAGNLATVLLAALQASGVDLRCGWPLPNPLGIAETGVLVAVILYLRWQKRLSARLLYSSHV